MFSEKQYPIITTIMAKHTWKYKHLASQCKIIANSIIFISSSMKSWPP